MTKTFCDRCGKEGRVDSIRLPKIRDPGWVYGPVDLCPECCHDIARFVEQKAGEQQEANSTIETLMLRLAGAEQDAIAKTKALMAAPSEQEIATLRQQLEQVVFDRDGWKASAEQTEQQLAERDAQHTAALIGYEQEADRLTAEALTLREQLAERDAQIARLTGADQ